jgi:hypothetical protein
MGITYVGLVQSRIGLFGWEGGRILFMVNEILGSILYSISAIDLGTTE